MTKSEKELIRKEWFFAYYRWKEAWEMFEDGEILHPFRSVMEQMWSLSRTLLGEEETRAIMDEVEETRTKQKESVSREEETK